MKALNGLRNCRVAILERRHPPGYQGAVIDQVVPLLQGAGARVEVVHAEEGLHGIDRRPAWDITVLKSGTAAALHLAAAAEGWGIPCVNTSTATRCAQDKLASTTLLQRAGLPIATGHLAWLPLEDGAIESRARLAELGSRMVLVKAARGSQGAGLWKVAEGDLLSLAATLPPGPYLIMEYVPHTGDDLKVFVAGSWIGGIWRPFPARTLDEKRGRPADIPPDVAEIARETGRLLGLTCFGCDFVASPEGWRLVDVNAFPGYKGPPDAAAGITAEIARVARGGAA